MHPSVHSDTIYNSQGMEGASMSIDRWKEKDVAHTHTHTHTHTDYLCHRKEWNNAICSNMDRPRDFHTKWSKPYRERQISYDVALDVQI